ncbi:dystrophin-like isoform X2 [Leptopilina boulardi]|uniref:dystrophin-like isoform X2 n=1 Tax=Leptopilina boulardi TaxID=63433 RepID=UPI0021F530F8|nr:dystrophin-like isoform X2 [Leptopilina boulardi]
MDESNAIANKSGGHTKNERNESNFSNCISMERLKSTHPKMEEILQSINECNIIRYASHRTASKIQILQKNLHMENVQLKLIAGIFERHRLSVTENSVNLDCHEIEDVLSDIFYAAQKEAGINFNVDQITKLAINFIFKIFHRNYEDNILVFSVKVVLTLMSSAKLEEKYGYLFHQLADHNACLSEAALFQLLTNICRIMEMLGESVAYGNHLIRSTVANCFKECQGSLGITEAEFAKWLMEEPPLLSWIATLNRIKSAEHIIHNIKCSTCKLNPICGPRYSCLRCAGYHQCQKCFLFGKTSGKHKLKHPIREYCIKASNKEVTKLVFELLRNKLMLCPSRSVISSLETSLPDMDENRRTALDAISVRSTIKRRICNDPQKELQNIISSLEEENRQLQTELLEISDSKFERLQNHRVAIQSQLERLKVLKNYLFKNQTGTNLIQSTPMIHPAVSRITRLPMAFELSPIVRDKKSENDIDDSLYRQQTTEKLSTDSAFNELSMENPQIELSTWIGGGKCDFTPKESGFSQWLGCSSKENNSRHGEKIIFDNNFTLSKKSNYLSPKNLPRDNSLYSIQKGKKPSQRSSIENIQGDLNDILDRLQNMVTNDCLLDESISVDNNCELKRAATEMEDLLTGLIEGMESRKTKLATIV